MGKAHYLANQEVYKAKARKSNQSLKEVLFKNLFAYLKEHPCVDCGETDPVVLEFDHTKGPKTKNVSDLIKHRYSWKRVLEEIQKCDVRCANCHRRKTAKDFNWYRFN